MVTIQSNSALLRLTRTPSSAGVEQIQISVPSGSTGGPVDAGFYLQAFGATGTATYTVSAPGYTSRTATVFLTPSGIVLMNSQGLPFVSLPSGGSAAVTIAPAQLNADGTFNNIEPLRGGLTLTPALHVADGSKATVAASVNLVGGADPTTSPVTTTLHGLSTGQTTLTVTQPGGFVAATNTIFAGRPMPTITVTVN